MTEKKTRKRAAKPKTPEEKTPPPVDVPAEGSLIRQDGAPMVYVMQGGQKRQIRDGAAMDSCGFGWNDIAVLPYEVVAPIPVGEIVTGPKDLQGA